MTATSILQDGKEILPEYEGETEVRDLLGATLRYSAVRRSMSITMEGAIDRMLEKFNMKYWTLRYQQINSRMYYYLMR